MFDILCGLYGVMRSQSPKLIFHVHVRIRQGGASLLTS